MTPGILQTESGWIRPESIAAIGGEQAVIALLAVDRESGRCSLLGYSPDDDAWIVVDEWAYEDLEHDSFYERLEEFERNFASQLEGGCLA